jgi:ATP-binding cassette subfamily B protein
MADGTGSPAQASGTTSGWGLIRGSARRQRLGIGIAVVAGLLWTLAKVSTGILVKHAIDDGIKADDPATLRFWALTLGGVAVASAVFTGLRRYGAFHAARWVETDLRDRMFAHLQRLHFGFHDTAQTGELMSRANTDLQQVQAFLLMIPLTISNGATVLAVTGILLFIDPLLTLLALGSLPLMNVLATRFSRRLHPYVMGIQRESAELAAVVEESVAGVRVVKGLGAEPIQARRLEAEADDVFEESLGAARTRARFVPALELLPTAGFIAVLGYGGHRVLDGSLSLGDLVAFNVYVAMLIWPLRMLGFIVAQAQRAEVSAGRVQEVLATEPAVTDPADPVALPAVPVAGPGPGAGLGEVRFEGVTFGYRGAPPTRAGPTSRKPVAPVLADFDLTVAPGESVALVGATGSGKSTVGRLLPRFYDVDAGRILLDGVDVRDVALAELRRAVGIVFEETFLFSDTIAANIAFADPHAPPEAIERAARLAGAHDFVRDLAEGYDTRIGERGYSLSGGQRQRIAIARAIVADPRVLVLDDATSAVDPTKEHEIRGALAEVMAGRTTLVIAHRPATIALADRVVLIDGGRVGASGTHDELLATSSRYRQVLAAGRDRGAAHVGA